MLSIFQNQYFKSLSFSVISVIQDWYVVFYKNGGNVPNGDMVISDDDDKSLPRAEVPQKSVCTHWLVARGHTILPSSE